jgi:hypothetical protein
MPEIALPNSNTNRDSTLQGRRVAVILTRQNIDRAWMQTVLAGGTPRVTEASGSGA